MTDHIPVVTARREMVRNRFFNSIEEDLIAPTGGYTYNFIACHYDAVVVVPVLPDGRLVVERIYRHPYHRYMHEFPAGGIERGEDPLVAGARELEEETGTRQLEALELLDVVHLSEAEAWTLAEQESASSFLTHGLLYLQRHHARHP